MDTEKISKFIATARTKIGLTQKELADKIGVSDNTLKVWFCWCILRFIRFTYIRYASFYKLGCCNYIREAYYGWYPYPFKVYFHSNRCSTHYCLFSNGSNRNLRYNKSCRIPCCLPACYTLWDNWVYNCNNFE